MENEFTIEFDTLFETSNTFISPSNDYETINVVITAANTMVQSNTTNSIFLAMNLLGLAGLFQVPTTPVVTIDEDWIKFPNLSNTETL